MGVKILSWEEFNKKEGGGKEVHIFSDDTLANAPTGEFEEIEEDGDEGTQEIENNQAEEEIDKTPKETSYRDWETDRKSTRLNSSHITRSRMPSSA